MQCSSYEGHNKKNGASCLRIFKWKSPGVFGRKTKLSHELTRLQIFLLRGLIWGGGGASCKRAQWPELRDGDKDRGGATWSEGEK